MNNRSEYAANVSLIRADRATWQAASTCKRTVQRNIMGARMQACIALACVVFGAILVLTA